MEESTRDSFIFHLEWAEILMGYAPEVRLEVYDAMIRYAQSGTLSELKPLAAMAFSFIQNRMDKDFSKYDEVCVKRAEAGRKSAAAKRQAKNADKTQQNQQVSTKVTSVEFVEQNQQKATKSTYTDIDTDIDIDITTTPLPPAGGTGGGGGCEEKEKELKIEDLVSQLKSATDWLAGIAAKLGIEEDQLPALIDDFISDCSLRGCLPRLFSSAQNRFFGFAKKHIQETKSVAQKRRQTSELDAVNEAQRQRRQVEAQHEAEMQGMSSAEALRKWRADNGMDPDQSVADQLLS